MSKKDIYERGLKEVDNLFQSKRFNSFFKNFISELWINDIRNDTISNLRLSSKLQKSNFSSCIQKFLNEDNYKTSDIELWKFIIHKCAENNSPFLFFSFLIAADALFKKINMLNLFYLDGMYIFYFFLKYDPEKYEKELVGRPDLLNDKNFLSIIKEPLKVIEKQNNELISNLIIKAFNEINTIDKLNDDIFNKCYENVQEIQNITMLRSKLKFQDNKLKLQENVYEDYSTCIKIFLSDKNYLTKNKEIWKLIIFECYKNKHYFLFLYFYLLFELLFKQLNKSDQLKPADSDIFFVELKNNPSKYLKLFKDIKPFLPIENISYELKKIQETIILEIEKNEQIIEYDKKDDIDKPIIQEAIITDISEIEKNEQIIKNDKKNDIDKPIIQNYPTIYNSLLMPSFLKETYFAVLNNRISSDTIKKMLYSNQGATSWRNKVLKTILILLWKLDPVELEKEQQEELVGILKVIWEMISLLGAKDNKSLNMNEPYNCLLALWEPELYIVIVDLTIRVFSKLDENMKFELNNPKIVFDHNLVHNLKTHQYTMGMYV